MDDKRVLLACAGLLQVLAIVVGFAVLGIVMKLEGYPEETFVRWTWLASFLRVHVVLVFIIPVVWLLLLLIAAQVDRGILQLEWMILIGFALAALIFTAYLYATVNSYTRPLLLNWPSR